MKPKVCPSAYLVALILTATCCLTGAQITAEIAPPWLKETWHTADQYLPNQDVARVYVDEHVAIYYDRDMNKSLTWPFQFLSLAWKYAKDTYGPFGSDPHLYVVMHANFTEHVFYNSSLSSQFNHRNLMDIAPLQNGNWSIQHSENIQIILSKIGEIIKSSAKQMNRINWNNDYCGEAFTWIIALDIYRHLVNHSDAKTQSNWAETGYDAPPDSLNCSTYFFLPIYEKYGGALVINNFFSLEYLHWQYYSERINGITLSGAMWVYFWSDAAGTDLISLARRTIRWEIKADLRSSPDGELEFAKKQFSQFRFFDLPLQRNVANKFLLPDFHQPGQWTIDTNGRSQDLKLLYHDGNVAFYSEEFQLPPMLLFNLFSKAWNYTKFHYNSLVSTNVLYVVLRNGTFDGCQPIKDTHYSSKDGLTRELIQCSTNQLLQKGNDFPTETYVSAFASLALQLSPGTKYWETNNELNITLASILAYDMFIGLNMTNEANQWKADYITKRVKLPRSNIESIYWFRDCNLPLYNQFGGPELLNRFFSILNSTLGSRSSSVTKPWNIGELVHFWSGAVGTDLVVLAINVFGDSDEYKDQFLKARLDYPNVSYVRTQENYFSWIWESNWNGSSKFLPIAFRDNYVQVYTDEIQLPTKLFQMFSRAIKYISDPPLELIYTQNLPYNVVLHNSTHWNCSKLTDSSTFVECGIKRPETIEASVILKEIMAYLLLDIYKKINTSESPFYSVSRFSLYSLVAYDIYKIADPEIADDLPWLTAQFQRFEHENQTWFRDWYYPIYALHGNSSVLYKFLRITEEVNRQDRALQFNTGEFVHFWSGAAGVNLLTFAKLALPWTDDNTVEFEKARKKFLNVTYVSETSKATPPKTFVVFEETLGRPQLLKDVYKDDHVTVFFDSSIPLTVSWPFHLLSTFSRFMKLYPIDDEAPDPRLNVIFHNKLYKGCNYSDTFSLATEFGSLTFNNTIDCGHKEGSNDTWAKESFNNLDIVISAAKSDTQEVAEGASNPAWGTLLYHIVVFDQYVSKGYLKDAHGWFKDKYKKVKLTFVSTKYWFKDWFCPLYTQYGGYSTLSRYINISEQRQAAIKNGSWAGSDEINVGEFTHLWSWAAFENLRDLADTFHTWNEEIQKQFTEARKALSYLSYNCFDCEFMPGHSNQQKGLSAQDQKLLYIIIGILGATLLLGLLGYKVRTHFLKHRIAYLHQEIRKLTNEELNEFFEGNTNASTGNTHASIAAMPFHKEYELRPENIAIEKDKVLGEGEFGLVVRGYLKREVKSKKSKAVNIEAESVEVAVKMVKPNVEVSYFKALLSEIKIMAHLGSHINITSLLGTLTGNIRNREVYVVLEFCSNGDLLNKLKKIRQDFRDLFNDKIGGDAQCHFKNDREVPSVTFEPRDSTVDFPTLPKFSTLDLLEWSSQIANGMTYLSSKNIIHGDLAARNVLLTSESVAKISDFGLSRQLINYSNYKKTSKTPLPFRWMAIESLNDMEFSIQSDTWSYGVTLWEIFTLGKIPYSGRTWDHNFVDELVAGQRLNSPDFANTDIYNIILDCMRNVPSERITFPQIRTQLDRIKASLSSTSIATTSQSCGNYMTLG